MPAELKASPQQPTLGAIARALRAAQQYTGQYQIDPRIPLLGGTGVDELLGLPGAAGLVEDVSYYGPRALIRGGNVATGGIGTFRPDPRVMDVVDVAGVVAPLAGAATKAAGRGAARAIDRAMLSGEGPLSALLAPAAPMNVVKPKGGNWLAGMPQKALAQLKAEVPEMERELSRPAPSISQRTGNFIRAHYPYISEAYENFFRDSGRHSMDYAKEFYPWLEKNYPNELEELVSGNTPAHKMNRWIDTKLAKYVRNEMGTPEDPLRELAKRGTSHIPRAELLNASDAGVRPGTMRRRGQAGFPISGVSMKELDEAGYPQGMWESLRAAAGWENLSDEALTSRHAGAFLVQTEYPYARPASNSIPANKSILEQNPWLAQIDFETPVYGVGVDNLGFSHLLDELAGAMYSNEDLPAHLRLSPDKLDKVSVPQAVELVSKINKHRAEEALRAERESMLANLKAEPRATDASLNLSFVDKPGATWVDIPETTAEDAVNFCTTIGKQAGWCTGNPSTARGYGSGDKRLLVMLDGEGRPHVQVQLVQGRPGHDDVLKKFEAAQAALDAETPGWYSRMSADETYRVVYNKAQQLASENLPQNIKELKPPNNAFTGQNAQEYKRRDPKYVDKISNSVLNFLNSGNWGRVNDLHHYNIVDLHPKLGTWENRVRDPRDMQALLDYNPDLPRFMPENEFFKLLREIDADGYAEGGPVNTNELEAIFGPRTDAQKVLDIINLRELAARFGPVGVEPVRGKTFEPTFNARASTNVMGLEPFVDVDPFEQLVKQYGLRYSGGSPEENYSLEATMDPATKMKMLMGLYRKDLGNDSDISAFGNYIFGDRPFYNANVVFRKRFAQGGAVQAEFDPSAIDEIVNKFYEEENG